MLVLVFLGLAGVAVPMFGSPQAYRLGWAATQLESDIVFAQAESFVHPDDRRLVVFDLEANHYSIATESDPLSAVTHPISGKPHIVTFGEGDFTHLSGVSIQSYALAGDDRLGFGAYGQLDQDSDATVVLAAGQATITVTVRSSTGGVSSR